jgi:hypothetical protein
MEVSVALHALPDLPSVPTEQEAGWTQCRSGRMAWKKILSSAENPVIQAVASHYTV